jgi:hypothetical protein
MGVPLLPNKERLKRSAIALHCPERWLTDTLVYVGAATIRQYRLRGRIFDYRKLPCGQLLFDVLVEVDANALMHNARKTMLTMKSIALKT